MKYVWLYHITIVFSSLSKCDAFKTRKTLYNKPKVAQLVGATIEYGAYFQTTGFQNSQAESSKYNNTIKFVARFFPTRK